MLAYVDEFPRPTVKVLELPSLRTRVVGAGDVPLVWAPRGHRLAYTTRAGRSTTIWHSSTGAHRRFFGVRLATWAPDGRRLVLEQGPPIADGVQRLFLADLAAKRVRKVAYGVQSDWRPTGDLIAFARKGCGRTQGLFVVNSSGADLRRIADNCTLRGTEIADSLTGGPRTDTVYGFGGADAINPGAGTDRVEAGFGDDRIDVRDEEIDTVACGGGSDVVQADVRDAVAADCETVTRAG